MVDSQLLTWAASALTVMFLILLTLELLNIGPSDWSAVAMVGFIASMIGLLAARARREERDRWLGPPD